MRSRNLANVWYLAFLLGATLSVPQPSWGVTLWSYDNLTNPNNLIKFDSATPSSVTVVGSSGVGGGHFFSSLDFDNAGNLWGYTQHASLVTGNALYSVNKANGAATFVGASGLPFGEQVFDMSWNPVGNQMQLLTYNGATMSLATINSTNGQATPIGAITGLPATPLSLGLATDAAGTNYVHDILSDSMYKLSGLSATLLGPEGIDTIFSQGMCIDWQGDGTWYHGAVRRAPDLVNDLAELYKVNLTTGAGTLVGFIGPGQLSYSTGDIAIETFPIPEPASLALVVLGFFGLIVWIDCRVGRNLEERSVLSRGLRIFD